MKITQMNGNAKNNLRGQRITITADDGSIVDRFVVTSRTGAVRYCNMYPRGKYGRRYFAALERAGKVDTEHFNRQGNT